MAYGDAWSWDETLMAFVAYLCMNQQQRNNKKNPVYVQLAQTIDRTPDAVYRKIFNIAAYDQNRIAEGHKGLSHGSKRDREVWQRLADEGDALITHAAQLLPQQTREALGIIEPQISLDTPIQADFDSTAEAPTPGSTVAQHPVPSSPPPESGTTALATVSTRIGQQYFRNSLIQNYGGACCMTGLAIPRLLAASHIKPWASDTSPEERMDASNGLLLNALHDKAFDQGLITVGFDDRIVVSSQVGHDEAADRMLWSLNGQSIRRPETRPPGRTYLEYHHDVVFRP